MAEVKRVRVVSVFVLLPPLLASNFVWQAMAGHDWGRAIERSWFQVMAVLTTVLLALWTERFPD